jgi:peptidoglycan/xylan/chitin deacetylase (PgdA/CDA1 family)
MFVSLMYHLVDGSFQNEMAISEQAFEWQLDVLDELGVTVISMKDVSAAFVEDTPAQPRVFLTFDDGYLNTTSYVSRVLDQRSWPALLAVCSSYLDGTDRPDLSMHLTDKFATAADVRKWIDGGRDIAGHTCSHPALVSLSDARLLEEVQRDKTRLETIFARPVDAFVYPYGAFDERVKEVVGRFYTTAFADSRGHWPRSSSRLSVGRLKVKPGWSKVDFRRRIEAAIAACTQDAAVSSLKWEA